MHFFHAEEADALGIFRQQTRHGGKEIHVGWMATYLGRQLSGLFDGKTLANPIATLLGGDAQLLYLLLRNDFHNCLL